MPHISKKRLEQEIFLAMYERFYKTIVSLKNRNESGKFMRELLTPTERIMLVKRLALVYMIYKGHSDYEIWNVLKISPSTVARYHLKSDSKEFIFLTSVLKKHEGLSEIFDKIESFLAHRGRGKGRWDFLNKL